MGHQDLVNVISSLPHTDTNGKRPLDGVNKLIVHHSAVDANPNDDELSILKSEALYQEHNAAINPGGNAPDGLQYHFVVHNGIIYQTRDLDALLWHASDYNTNVTSLAVCIAGNYDDQELSDTDRKALDNLIYMLSFDDATDFQELKNINTKDGNSLFGHSEVADPGLSTQCPGTNLLPIIKAARETKLQSEVNYWNSKTQVTTPPVTPSIPTTDTTPSPDPIVELNNQIKDLQSQLQVAINDRDNLKSQLQDIQNQLNSETQKEQSDQTTISDLNKSIQDLNNQINDLKNTTSNINPLIDLLKKIFHI